MAEDWASKIRESIQRSNQAMDLSRRQAQAAAMNSERDRLDPMPSGLVSGNRTRYTALDTGGIADIPMFTPAPAGMSASQFSGAPIESASFYGSGQINEVGPRPDSNMTPATPVWGTPYEEGQGDGGGQGGAPTPNRRPRRGSDRWEMGDDGRMVDPNTGQHRIVSRRDGSTKATPSPRNSAGGLNQHFQNQRNASSWENLQRRSNYMPPSQQTPRQRFAS